MSNKTIRVMLTQNKDTKRAKITYRNTDTHKMTVDQKEIAPEDEAKFDALADAINALFPDAAV